MDDKKVLESIVVWIRIAHFNLVQEHSTSKEIPKRVIFMDYEANLESLLPYS